MDNWWTDINRIYFPITPTEMRQMWPVIGGYKKLERRKSEKRLDIKR